MTTKTEGHELEETGRVAAARTTARGLAHALEALITVVDRHGALADEPALAEARRVLQQFEARLEPPAAPTPQRMLRLVR